MSVQTLQNQNNLLSARFGFIWLFKRKKKVKRRKKERLGVEFPEKENRERSENSRNFLKN